MADELRQAHRTCTFLNKQQRSHFRRLRCREFMHAKVKVILCISLLTYRCRHFGGRDDFNSVPSIVRSRVENALLPK